MEKHDWLVEHYEDALFALLMEAVAESEGKKALLLNEELLLNPDAAVPSEINNRMEKTIRAAFAKTKREQHKRSTIKLLHRIAIVALLSILMFTFAFATSEEFRVRTLNAVIEVFDDHSVLSFRSDPVSSAELSPSASGEGKLEYHYNIAVEWIPSGFSLDSGWTRDEGSGDFVSYVDENNAIIDVWVLPYTEGTKIAFDSENCLLEEILIDGFTAFLYSKTEEANHEAYCDNPEITSDLTLIWINDVEQTVTHINANNLTKEELITLAEGIRWNNK